MMKSQIREKLESELRAILKGGCGMLMICSFPDVLHNEGVSKVLKNLCEKRKMKR